MMADDIIKHVTDAICNYNLDNEKAAQIALVAMLDFDITDFNDFLLVAKPYYTMGEKAGAADMRGRCAGEIQQKAEYYRAVGKRDDREDMMAHALTCEDLLRIINALEIEK